jgi:hypothetical protein
MVYNSFLHQIYLTCDFFTQNFLQMNQLNPKSRTSENIAVIFYREKGTTIGVTETVSAGMVATPEAFAGSCLKNQNVSAPHRPIA